MKTLLVTGGSRGIGAATARLAAERGYAVCVNYLQDRAAADKVVAAIHKDGGKAIAVQADIGVEQDVVRLFEHVDRELGRLTALVNNAATLEAQMRLDQMDAARMQRMFASNAIGAMLCSREAVRRGMAALAERSSTFLRARRARDLRASMSITRPPRARSIPSRWG